MKAIYKALDFLLTNQRNPANADEAERKRLLTELRCECEDSESRGGGFIECENCGRVVGFEPGELMPAKVLACAECAGVAAIEEDGDDPDMPDEANVPAVPVKAVRRKRKTS